MIGITKVTLNSLMIVVCVVSSPLFFSAFSASVEAAPRTSGRPGRVEPGGRRAVQPQDIIRSYRVVD